MTTGTASSASPASLTHLRRRATPTTIRAAAYTAHSRLSPRLATFSLSPVERPSQELPAVAMISAESSQRVARFANVSSTGTAPLASRSAAIASSARVRRNSRTAAVYIAAMPVAKARNRQLSTGRNVCESVSKVSQPSRRTSMAASNPNPNQRISRMLSRCESTSRSSDSAAHPTVIHTPLTCTGITMAADAAATTAYTG